MGTDRKTALVFQCLVHTFGMPAEQWRVLDGAHRKRNVAEYEGQLEIDDTFVAAVCRVASEVMRRVGDLIAT